MPEQNEFTELRYTPAVESLYVATIWIATALAYGSCVSAACFFAKSTSKGDGIALLVLTFGWLLAAIAFVPAFFTLRARALLLLRLYGDRVAIDRFGKIREVPFNDVRRASFSSIPGVGAWFVLHRKSGGRNRFSASVLGSEHVLESLRLSNPEACTEEELRSFQIKARALSFSWRRFQAAIDAWPWLLWKYLAFPALAGVLIPDLILMLKQGQTLHYYQYHTEQALLLPIVFACFIAVVFGIFTHWLGEVVLRVREARKGTESPAFERAAQLSASLLYYALALGTYAFLFLRTH